MYLPFKKRIKSEENDIVERPINCQMIVDGTEATNCPCPPNTHLQNVKNPKETIVNIDFDDKPLLLPMRGFQHWCKIFFGDDLAQNDGYKLGKIVLKLTAEKSNAYEKLKSDFTNSNIIQHFPGLDTIRMQVEGQSGDSKNTVNFRTRREISKEDATPILMSKSNKRPPPKDGKYIEVKHFTYTFEKLNLPPALFGKPGKLETRKIFKIEFEKYDAIYKEIILQVKVYSSAIKGDPNYMEATAPDMTDAIPVLDYYFLSKRKEPSINASLAQYRSSDDVQRFYSLMRDYHSDEIRPNPDDSIQDPRMIPQLLDYQKEAVVWMLSREGVLEFNDDDNDTAKQLQTLLSLNMNKRVNLKAFGNKCLQDVYYSRASGCISWEKQKVDKLPNRGGILADEMGLGKTIEVLSLILLNQRPDVTDFKSEFDSKSADDVDVKYLAFECTCGISDQKKKNIITCCDCGNSQHSNCLGFNETNGVQVPNKYLCPHCIGKLPPMPSKSTLIVVPNSILKQWAEEIEINISDDSLKIHIYSGKNYVHPVVLSQYDVVLTTYEVLRREIHFTDLTEEKRLRDPRRFAALPCPLILVEWWRVCLDEAQMVETVNRSFAKMACMLPAVHRWCVTGTPIPNGLQDLYGVVCFLGIEPITDIKWWTSLIMEPFKLNNSLITITTNLFGKIFWRTEREDVQDQMRLPRQTQVIHRLKFTPAEKYFYEQRSKYWINEFKGSIENIERDQPISTLSNSHLLPFRRLRHICTHPQLDEEAFKAVDIFIERKAKLTLSVSEFVEWLVKRATASCRKQFKLQVVALNGLAGLHSIKNELEVAARQYRRVIQLAEEHNDRWKTYDINLLHALINLNDVTKKLGCGEIDETLDTRVDELIRKLMQKKINEVSIASNAISFKEIREYFGAEGDAWWMLVLNHIRNSTNAVQLLQELVQKLKKTIPFEFIKLMQPSSDIFDFVTNVQNTLLENLFDILLKREEIFSHWKKLKTIDVVPPYLSLSLLECDHYSKSMPMNSADLPSCVFCSFESELSNYESLLGRAPEERDNVIEAIWIKSLTENILDVIYQFGKKNQLPETMLADGKRHIGQFCDLQNEIQGFWKWYIKINNHAIALKALLQETKPIKLNSIVTTTTAASSSPTSSQQDQIRYSSVSKLRRLSVLEPDQISLRIQLEISALELSNQKFNACLCDLKYLKGLQIYGYSSSSSTEEMTPKTCTVDHPLQKWGFLPCSHFFCANCCPETDNYEFDCSICSKKFYKQMVRFIDMNSHLLQRDDKAVFKKLKIGCVFSGLKHVVTNIPSWTITNDKIWRNPFTKVEGVIRTLLTIRQSHPNEKALVICTCDAMLHVFAAEFHQNHISYVLYKFHGKANRIALLRYRTDSTQVLLMPLTVASTGLNVTEANHVLLVEPYLNLAIEEQAIGRIHRLGQKKPTFVHRFYVADSIEEKLVRIDEDKKMSTFVEGNMTIQHLLDLFEDNSPNFQL